ncbi:MAG: hypothetical protein R6X02_11370 [Enhygromyxa sp.]
MRRLIPALVSLGLATAACSGDDAEPPGDSTEAGDAEEQGDEGETGEPPSALGDRCVDTELIIEAPTTLAATLRHASPDPDELAEACGLSGPVVFARVSVHDRVDLQVLARGRAFTPKLAVSLPGCVADPGRVLACGEGLPVTLRDLGPDLELLVALGIDEADPALELPAVEHADPLDLELRLEVRAVLGEHARCGPGFGRCEAGTVCLPADEDGVVIDRCRRPPADSCVAPGTLAVLSPGAAAMIEIAPDDAHSDAHEHSCTGWRRPERVERLELPAGLGEAATLWIEADDPRVGLALRGPDCLPEGELACAPALAGGEVSSLSFGGQGQLAVLAAADEAPLLFVELPREDDADPPASVLVRVEIVD